MQQLQYNHYFIVFKRIRPLNEKIILYVLTAILNIPAIVQIVPHTIPNIHMPAVFANSDPWNG